MPNRLRLAEPDRDSTATGVPFAFGATCCMLGLVSAGLSVFILSAGGDRTGAALVLVLTASLVSVMLGCIVRGRKETMTRG